MNDFEKNLQNGLSFSQVLLHFLSHEIAPKANIFIILAFLKIISIPGMILEWQFRSLTSIVYNVGVPSPFGHHGWISSNRLRK